MEKVFGAGFAHAFHLAFDLLSRYRTVLSPAAFSQIGQRFQRLRSGAETLQQHGIADRADIG